MFRFKTLAAALTLSFALPGLAQAATVSVRDNPNVNGGSVFAPSASRTIDIVDDGDNRSVRAGVFSLQYGSDADGWIDFLTFCLQLDETLSLPRNHERVAGAAYFMSPDDLNALGILYGKLLDGQFGPMNRTLGAALQSIVWEIVEDGATSFNLTDGDFELRLGGQFNTNTSNVLATALGVWDMIMLGQHEPIGIDVFRASHTQDLIVSDVPIPGAALLLLSGVFGLGFASRKQKKAGVL